MDAMEEVTEVPIWLAAFIAYSIAEEAIDAAYDIWVNAWFDVSIICSTFPSTPATLDAAAVWSWAYAFPIAFCAARVIVLAAFAV